MSNSFSFVRTFCTSMAVLVLAVLGLVAVASASVAAPTFLQDEETISFEAQIKPILETHCVSCHKEDKDEGGARMDIADDALRYVEPGDLDRSDLYQHLLGEEELMPPEEENDPLSEEQIQTVATWIMQGADWPEGMNLTEVARVQAADTPAVGQTPAIGQTTDETTADTTDPAAEPVKKADDTVYRAIGSLHPAAVHLPIGLLLAAGLFALFSLRGNFVMSDCAYYCLWLGTLGAITACVSGWWFSPMNGMGTVEVAGDLLDETHKVYWHRSAALISTAVALLLALFAAGARAKDPEDGVLWKMGCIVLACGIGYTGHLGGELTHGENLYKDLNKLFSGIWAPADPGDVDGNNEGAGDGANDAGANGADPNNAVPNGAGAKAEPGDTSTDADGNASTDAAIAR